MKKNVIYVDFIFTKKRTNFLLFHVYNKLSFINKYFKLYNPNNNVHCNIDDKRINSPLLKLEIENSKKFL